MLDRIKRLGTETAVYGVSTIVGRFLTFLLTPVYANILPVSDVGVIATLYAYVAFLNVIFGYGMEGAYMKYSSTRELGDEKQNFSVPFFSTLATGLLFSGAIIWQREELAGLASLGTPYHVLILYAAWILFLDAVCVVPFASLRMAGKAKTFAFIKLVNIVVNVGCNLFLLLHVGTGIEAVFISNVIASALTVILLLPTVFQSITLSFDKALWLALLRFGLPTVPAYIAAMMIQVIDRPILESLTDLRTVGIYQANYRLGIFMMLVVSMFDFAWRPFFFQQAREPDAKHVFARVLTYFVLLTTTVFLVITLFLEDVVTVPMFWGRSVLPAQYWPGLAIVPVVLLAYIFLGVSNILSAGVYIEKKTSRLPAVTMTGALVNVAANFILIPVWGIMGAAVATLASYGTMCLVLFVIVRHIYPIEYEWRRIAKILLGSGGIVAGNAFVQIPGFETVWKVVLVVLFIGLMGVMKFFDPAELAGLRRLVRFGGRAQDSAPLPNNEGA